MQRTTKAKVQSRKRFSNRYMRKPFNQFKKKEKSSLSANFSLGQVRYPNLKGIVSFEATDSLTLLMCLLGSNV